MEIYPQSTDQRTARAPQAAADHSVITADFETFLTLLTTQLKNQDPLNPLESTEYATQLATFSGVEQQVRTNTLLESLSTGFGTLGMGQLGGWIGMEAVAPMPVAFDGTPVTVQATPAARADRMDLVVTSQSGGVVQRVPIPLFETPFTWTGQDAAGGTVPPGTYRLAIESWSGEELLDARPVSVAAIIEEARLADGQIYLTMQGGVSIPADSVEALRRGG
jgi:flagellar basal-body rod modification protein FlgD